VFVSAPTGADAFDCLNGESSCNSNNVVLMVVPLISFMKDQVLNLNPLGISVSYVEDCSEQQLQDILVI